MKDIDEMVRDAEEKWGVTLTSEQRERVKESARKQFEGFKIVAPDADDSDMETAVFYAVRAFSTTSKGESV